MKDDEVVGRSFTEAQFSKLLAMIDDGQSVNEPSEEEPKVPVEEAPTAPKKRRKRAVDEKWGVAGASFTQVPNLLIENMARLELKSPDIVVLLFLIKHWWFGENSEARLFPSTSKIARGMGVDKRQVQRILKRLEENPAPVVNGWSDTPGYIRRVSRHTESGRQRSNSFNLDRLVWCLQSLAHEKEELVEEMGKRKARGSGKRNGSSSFGKLARK